MAISLIILLPSILAIEFQLNSPQSAIQNEEFKVSITANVTENYDVKIYIEDPNSKPKTISEIFNGNEWQNSYFYLKAIFPKQSEFNLKATKLGDWEICARLRKDVPTKPVCNQIIVNPSNSAQQEDSSNKEASKEKEQDNTLEEAVETKVKNEEETNIEYASLKIENASLENSSIPTQEFVYTQEKIILNTIKENPKKNEQGIYITKYEKLRLVIIYGFTLLCVIIIILFALRRL